MKIAIVDDDKNILIYLEEIVRAFFSACKCTVDIQIHQTGESLIFQMKKSCIPDIVLLDIELGGNSGFDYAKIVKDISDRVILIFITSHTKYMHESFLFEPFRYLVKQNLKVELPLALSAAKRKHELFNNEMVEIKFQNLTKKVPYSRILAFHKEGQRIVFHFKNGSTESSMTNLRIKDLMREFEQNGFVKIHSGCAVNAHYIKDWTRKSVKIEGIESPFVISRGRYAYILAALYCLEEN